MDAAATFVASGRQTPICCPECGDQLYGVLVTPDPDVVHLLPCDHDVTLSELYGRSRAAS